MTPRWAGIIARSASRACTNMPRALIARIWSHSSTVISATVRLMMRAALLTRMSSRPKRAIAVSTAARAVVSCDTSPVRATISPSISRSPTVSLMSSATTRAPRRWSSSTVARPTPPAAPVTMATRPSRSRRSCCAVMIGTPYSEGGMIRDGARSMRYFPGKTPLGARCHRLPSLYEGGARKPMPNTRAGLPESLDQRRGPSAAAVQLRPSVATAQLRPLNCTVQWHRAIAPCNCDRSIATVPLRANAAGAASAASAAAAGRQALRRRAPNPRACAAPSLPSSRGPRRSGCGRRTA